MSYEFYKIVHVVSFVLFVVSATAVIYGKEGKVCKAFNGIVGLIIFVAGMGLIARIGISHGGVWPLWIKLKILLWLLAMVAAAVGARRLSRYRRSVVGTVLGIVCAAVVVAVLKPY